MELRVKRAPRIDLEITVPGDKSISHRAVIVAALSNGVCTVRGFLPSEDCMHTVNAMRALGIKIEVAGRLSGAEMARSVWLREGRVPLQTIRANIDFARAEALTQYGKIGIKVWVYVGNVLPGVEEKAESTEGVYVSE